MPKNLLDIRLVVRYTHMCASSLDSNNTWKTCNCIDHTVLQKTPTYWEGESRCWVDWMSVLWTRIRRTCSSLQWMFTISYYIPGVGQYHSKPYVVDSRVVSPKFGVFWHDIHTYRVRLNVLKTKCHQISISLWYVNGIGELSILLVYSSMQRACTFAWHSLAHGSPVL